MDEIEATAAREADAGLEAGTIVPGLRVARGKQALALEITAHHAGEGYLVINDENALARGHHGSTPPLGVERPTGIERAWQMIISTQLIISTQ